MSPEQCNALFDRMGELLGDVFTFARRLGIKTCIGTETPLTIPTPVKQRLQAAGKNPADPAVVQELYEGMFQRIAKIHPLDYYWLWTPEDWTWEAVKQAQIDATMADFRAAIGGGEEGQAAVHAGHVRLGARPAAEPGAVRRVPAQGHADELHQPHGGQHAGRAGVRQGPRAAEVGHSVDGRRSGLTMPQLWAGRMRRDAVDALQVRLHRPDGHPLAHPHPRPERLGLGQGRVGSERVGARRPSPMAAADGHRRVICPWPISTPIGPGRSSARRRPSRSPRSSPGWTATCRGRPIGSPAPAASGPTNARGSKCKRNMPLSTSWRRCGRGSTGPGNLERFDYWLNNFRYLRSIAEVRCVWARFNAALAKVKAEKDPQAQKKLARELALPVRKELVAAFAELHRHLLATVTNPGEMGNVCNWQQQTLPVLLTAPGQELAKLLGEDLPADAMPSKAVCGPAAAVRARGPHGHRGRRDAAADGDRAGGQAASGRTLLAAAGRRTRLPKCRWHTSPAACTRSRCRPRP